MIHSEDQEETHFNLGVVTRLKPYYPIISEHTARNTFPERLTIVHVKILLRVERDPVI